MSNLLNKRRIVSRLVTNQLIEQDAANELLTTTDDEVFLHGVTSALAMHIMSFEQKGTYIDHLRSFRDIMVTSVDESKRSVFDDALDELSDTLRDI